MPTPSMRLAVVTTYPPGKGSLNEYAYHFVRFLRQKEDVHEVILLVDELPPGATYTFEQRPDLAPVRVLPCWRFDANDNALRIWRAVQQIKPDGVLFNIQFATFGSRKIPATLGLLAPTLVKWAGYPTIVLLHNIVETVDLKSAGFGNNMLMEGLIRLVGTQVTRCLLSADLVALTIPKYVEVLEAKYHAKNVVLAPHGAFEDTPPPSFTLPPGPRQIMTFGKFGTYKKVETLIEAFQLLQQREARQSMKMSEAACGLELVIAGTDSPNAVGYLSSIQQRYRAVPNLRFTGYVAEEDVPHLFNNATVVVFPYTSTTGSSGVLHQTGDYGKAAVLPHIGDFAEVIAEEGYAGEFFTPGDPEDLANAIARVLYDPMRRRELETQNYIASRSLSIADVVDWYLLHFHTLCKEHRRPLRKNTMLNLNEF